MAALPPTASVAVPASSPPAVDPAAYMVCAPLDTVEELLAWRPPTAVLGPAAFVPPYAPPPRTVQHEALRRGQLLVCHDMKGALRAGCWMGHASFVRHRAPDINVLPIGNIQAATTPTATASAPTARGTAGRAAGRPSASTSST